MKQLLLALIGIALLQSICMLLIDDAKQKSIIRFTGGVAMVTMLLGSVLSFDYSAYASMLRSRLHYTEMTDAAQEENQRLNRMFIEKQCSAYILDKAAALGTELSGAAVTLSWNTDGYWYPSAAELTIPHLSKQSQALADVIQTDLGIPLSSQTWREEGGGEP